MSHSLKDGLIRAAEELFGVAPWVARGILAEAPDDVTVEDAAARITAILTTQLRGAAIVHPAVGLRTLPDVDWSTVADGEPLVYNATLDRIVGGTASIGVGVQNWSANTNFPQYAVVVQGSSLFQAIDAHRSGATFAGDQSAHWRQLDPETDATAIAQLATHAALGASAHGGLIPASAKGAAGGVAALDASARVPYTSLTPAPERRIRIRRPALTVITSFDTGHGWSSTNGVASDDTADYFVPDRSLALTYNVAASGRVTSPTLAPIDLTVKGLVFATKVSDRSLLSSLDLEISSNAFANFIALQSMKGDPRNLTDGEWAAIPMQVSADNGANATNTAITGLRSKGQATAGAQPVVTHGLAATYPLDGVARAVIFLDDGTDDQNEMALRALKVGIKVCMAIRPGALGTTGHLTVAQALDLQARGVEMVPHAFNVADHDNTALYQDPVAFEASLINMRNKLIELGLVSGLEHYCYAPNFDGSRTNAAQRTAFDLVKKWYPGLARTASVAGFNGPIEAQAPFDMERRLRVGQFTVGTNSALTNWTTAGTGWLDRIAYSKGVGIGVFHKMQTAADSGLYISRANWDLFMQALAARVAAGTIKSCTLTEAYADAAQLGADGRIPTGQLPLTTLDARYGTTVPVVTKATGFTITSAEAGSRYSVSATGSVIATIPTNAADPIPVGTVYEVARRGVGPVAFSPSAGVTLNSYGNYVTLARQWSEAALVKVGPDEWDLVGDLA